jgi:hypothetical protein
MFALKLDKKSAPTTDYSPSLSAFHGSQRWLLDVICLDSDNPGIIFYNKLTGFSVGLKPTEYNLSYCMDVFQELLLRLLSDSGLTPHIFHLFDLFRTQHLYRNNDRSANAYMGQVKISIAWWLDLDNKSRVNNSYDLLYRINDEYRINYHTTVLEAFLTEVRRINKPHSFSVHSDILGRTIH